MSGHQAFDELTKGFTPERRARVDARKAELRAAMPLHDLRQARAMTQKAVGDALNVKQPAVARLERRADMYVSSLRASIEAMGGRLTIVAEFPHGSVAITNFAEAGEDGETASGSGAPRPSSCPASPRAGTGSGRSTASSNGRVV